jgi:hypothetical protein
MNVPINETGSHPTEPVRTTDDPLEYEWLTVDQAVAFCATLGLSRTPKTLRKWADRSFNKEDADVVVRREDTMWSYRWKIEKTSLARKVDQELSLAGANVPEPVRTSSIELNKKTRENPENPFDPVRTRADAFPERSDDQELSEQDEPRAKLTEPVRTGAHDIRPVGSTSDVLEEVRQRLSDKDAEIDFLRGQLGKAQAEVERRATSTDEALKTIDRVVRSFEMQAEANKALALSGVPTSPPDATEPIRYSENEETKPAATKLAAEVEITHSYQQTEPEWGSV